MIILILLSVVTICLFLTSCMKGAKPGWFVALYWVVAPVSLCLVVLSGCALCEWMNSDANIIEFKEIKEAVAFASGGDPSYSGLFLEAAHKNGSLAIAKMRNQSIWWDCFYNDEYCKLTPILLPGQELEQKK